jgi:putative spermidine/putrescine transport system permease protein
MSRSVPWRYVWLTLGLSYLLIPLVGVAEFSLRMRRGVYSLDAYGVVLADPQFQQTFLYSAMLSLAAVVLAVLLVVPAAYVVHLRLPRLRPVLEFVTLLPLVVPAIVIVFGYFRLYGSSSWIALTNTEMGANVLLACGYATLALPYLYRAVDTGLTAIDVRTLTEAAESLGASPMRILVSVILPNIRAALLSGAFLTVAIVLGDFTFASLLDRPGFGPYMQLLGANRAYEPAALSVIAFVLTWALMALIGTFSQTRTRSR